MTAADGLLAGRRALVTGAARGIGLATARRFREAGAAVFLADRDAGALERAGGELACPTGTLDVGDPASVEACVEAACAALGGLDVAVANAGILTVGRSLELPLDDWAETLRVNLTGAYLTARAAAPRIAEAGGGSLLFTSSQAGLRGYRQLAAYCASKFGVIGLTQALADELAPLGVRVNAVAPGLVRTEMQDDLARRYAEIDGIDEQAVRERWLAGVPLGRLAEPEDVADAFVYLASPLASYVTGVVLPVEGGEMHG